MTTETAAPAASDSSTTEQDEQAFAAGFSEGRGETPPTTEPAAKPIDQPAAEATPAQPAAPAAPEPPAKVLAGLTEDEIKQVFAMVPGLKQQVDKLVNEEIRRLNGYYGGLNEEIKKLKTSSGQSPRTFKASDLDEEFVREFPEIADMVARSLSKVMSGQAPAPTAAAAPQPAAPAAPAAQPATQPPTDINALVQQRVDAAIATVNERAEKRTLAALHPDWETVAQTPEFAKWMQTLPADQQKHYGESGDALVAAEAFTKFKAAQKKTNSRKQQNQQRLEDAIQPTGDGAPTATTLDDEAAFQAGFTQARAGA